MSIEEKIKREILVKELARDPALAHCFIKIEDAEKLFCMAYLAVACADVRPEGQWGHLTMSYKRVIAQFAVETIWPKLSEREQDEWLDIVEKWTAPVYKKLTVGDGVRARLATKTTREMSEELGVSYDITYRRILSQVKPFEKMPKLQPIFDTRTPHQKTLEHLKEPRRAFVSDILGCRGVGGRDGKPDKARALLYRWLEHEEHPEFDMDYLKALTKSRRDYFEEHNTIEGWSSDVPLPDKRE